ncbi:MAG: M20/M25/M40 family metallo-hydrolase, partial [Lachnospiraceae bacterium]|nr:M20/M25/M40 family metallo-hydrolase [Lachnospiraceae bacterium]
WGRGSADDKSSLMAILQAAEELLSQGFVPDQDVYFSFSNTEEVGGEGCPKLVQHLKSRGVKPFLVNDEGGAITTNPISGIPGNFAMVGILEKGQGDLLISARSQGGHSSYPSKNSPIARLSRFVCEIEKHNPMKSRATPQLKTMMETLGAYGPFYYRLLFGNFWLFGPLLTRLMPLLSPQAGALLRTTTAFTMQSGSDGCNVMPQEATLTINLRYMPHQNREESNELIRKLAAKYHLEVREIDAYDACRPVSTRSAAFRLVEEAVGEVFPGLPFVPYIMTGGTDARFYEEICDACVRFAPIIYGPDQMKGMHGLNEYLEAACLPGAVDYYKALIRLNTGEGEKDASPAQ